MWTVIIPSFVVGCHSALCDRRILTHRPEQHSAGRCWISFHLNTKGKKKSSYHLSFKCVGRKPITQNKVSIVSSLDVSETNRKYRCGSWARIMVVTLEHTLPTDEELTVPELKVTGPTLRAAAFHLGKYCQHTFSVRINAVFPLIRNRTTSASPILPTEQRFCEFHFQHGSVTTSIM